MAKKTSKKKTGLKKKAVQPSEEVEGNGQSSLSPGGSSAVQDATATVLRAECGVQAPIRVPVYVDCGVQTVGDLVECAVQTEHTTVDCGVQAGKSDADRKRAEKRSLEQKLVDDILPRFKKAYLSPFDLVVALLDEGQDKFKAYRTALYQTTNTRLHSILDLIASSTQGGADRLTQWVKGKVGTAFVGNVVADEIEAIKPDYTLKGLKDVTPEYIKHREQDNFTETAPFTTGILRAAAQSERQAAENTTKTPDLLCRIMMLQILYQRSQNCLGFAAEFGLFLWATGASRATIEAVHALGLCVRYQSVLNHLGFLAEHCMELAIVAALGFFAFCYDNVNLSTSIHVEQRGTAGTPGKVTSGTLAIVYPLPKDKATPEVMDLKPILENMKAKEELTFEEHLTPSAEEYTSILQQFRAHIIRVIATYGGLDLSQYEGDDEKEKLLNKPRRPGRYDSPTEFHPIRVSTTEEASISGNLKFQQEAHIDMLKGDPEKLSKYAIPTINDQLTNSRIRSGQIIRADDLNNFHRRLVYQLAMGLFHAALNLAWCLLQSHRGTMHQIGSLAFWFVVLEKARLAGAKPDYHTLYAALMQVLEGLLMACWLEVCTDEDPELTEEVKKAATLAQKKKALSDYVNAKPSADDLQQKATTILNDFATPLPPPYTKPGKSGNDGSSEDEEEDEEAEDDEPLIQERSNVKIPPPVPHPAQMDPLQDKLNQNIRLFMRDVLYLLELVCATRDGDFGRVEDILVHLAMIYRGAGSNNYCSECLHLIKNLRQIWPGDFANIMRDIMIVNPSGIPGHCIATDTNMEYEIREIKELIIAKGCEDTWDHVGDIAAAIESLKEIKRKMVFMLGLPHQNKGHSNVDTSHLVWRVAERAEKDGFVVFKAKRRGNTKVVARSNLLDEGAKKLLSGTLASFNTKFFQFVDGMGFEEEEDELSPVDMAVFPEDVQDGAMEDSASASESENGSEMDVGD